MSKDNQGAIFIASFSEQLIREKVTMPEPEWNPEVWDFRNEFDLAVKEYKDHVANRRTFPYDVKEEQDGQLIPESEFRLQHQRIMYMQDGVWGFVDCTKTTYELEQETERRIIAIPIEPDTHLKDEIIGQLEAKTVTREMLYRVVLEKVYKEEIRIWQMMNEVNKESGMGSVQKNSMLQLIENVLINNPQPDTPLQPVTLAYTKYLLEDKREQYGKWLKLSNEILVHQYGKGVISGGEETKWTNNANEAIQWDTKKEADQYFDKFYKDIHGYEITEHEFISQQPVKDELMNDPFIKKHLARIKELTLEYHIQDKLQHLQRPPFDASVKYFLETGTVNGSFLLAIKSLFDNLPKVISEPASKEQQITYDEIMSHPKWDEVHDLLKEEGYSTGSEEAYDKLYDECKRRIRKIILEESSKEQEGDVENAIAFAQFCSKKNIYPNSYSYKLFKQKP